MIHRWDHLQNEESVMKSMVLHSFASRNKFSDLI